ncbi:ParB/RepB/Spo0J family partition protein [Tumebacillus permanentifrigoris]|uniref:ParB family chromosome partitioning protein n=1 Tax=Tumebacillus permanentifrigoris TaxID=378543 RepID=A0A316E1B2_9BACL|nr:ParB/RepB/Spo0J family partition protein [Tumebacillus permanentifrigoris]PWK16600.1 ParB family chromosome partitioning protein [Tumebacillus permanentifrigoris]
MNKKQGGLGRGLDAIFHSNPKADDNVTEAAPKDMRPNPYQPRRVFDEEKMAELVQSVKEHGIIQPIVVRQAVRGYEIVAGERRWRAAQAAGFEMVPVVVRDFTDEQMNEIALIENLQREDLNPIEVAEAYQSLMDTFHMTQDVLAKKVGQSRSHVANTLRLLNLPSEIREHVSRGTLSMGHARALLGLNDKKLQIQLAEKTIDEELSVREVEHMVNRLQHLAQREATPKRAVKENPILKQYEEEFRFRLGTGVKIHQGKKRGKIEIEYFSQDDLERILGLLESK